MRKNLLLFLACVIFETALTQSLRYPLGAAYTGMNTCSKNFADAFSASVNPALFCRLKDISAGIYGDRRFGLKELAFSSAVIAIPFQHSGIGVNLNYFGSSLYNEAQAGLGYAKDLGKLALGIRFNYHSIRIPIYGSDATFTSEIASIWQLTDQLVVSIQAFNPFGGKFGKNKNEKMASAYKAGIGYEVSANVFFGAEVIKEEDRPAAVIAGLQYIVASRLFMRAGLNTDIPRPYLGFGWKWKNIRLDISGSYHLHLGFTPGFMILFAIQKKKEP